MSVTEDLLNSGASYCDVGYRHSKDKCTPEQPLGIEYPGVTYAEPGTPNWVGYLVNEYKIHEEMVAYCYAVGGSVVEGVKSTQIEKWFLEGAGKKPTQWTATDSLFGERVTEVKVAFVDLRFFFIATWIGINDLALVKQFILSHTQVDECSILDLTQISTRKWRRCF